MHFKGLNHVILNTNFPPCADHTESWWLSDSRTCEWHSVRPRGCFPSAWRLYWHANYALDPNLSVCSATFTSLSIHNQRCPDRLEGQQEETIRIKVCHVSKMCDILVLKPVSLWSCCIKSCNVSYVHVLMLLFLFLSPLFDFLTLDRRLHSDKENLAPTFGQHLNINWFIHNSHWS